MYRPGPRPRPSARRSRSGVISLPMAACPSREPRACFSSFSLRSRACFVNPRRHHAQAPPGCPTPGIELLSPTHGSWEVTWRDRLAPGRYDTTVARATIEPTALGCGLLERFAGTREGRPFSALALIGPSAGDSLQRIWQDSSHGSLLVFGAAAAGRPLASSGVGAWGSSGSASSTSRLHPTASLPRRSFREMAAGAGTSWPT